MSFHLFLTGGEDVTAISLPSSMWGFLIAQLPANSTVVSVHYDGTTPVMEHHIRAYSCFNSRDMNALLTNALAQPAGNTRAALANMVFEFANASPCKK